MAPIPFLFFSFLWAREICTQFTNILRGSINWVQYNKGPTPFLRRLLKAREICTYKTYPAPPPFSFVLIFRKASEKYPVSRPIGLKTPHFRFFSGKSPWAKRPKYTPFPGGNTHAAPCTFESGGGGGLVPLTVLYTIHVIEWDLGQATIVVFIAREIRENLRSHLTSREGLWVTWHEVNYYHATSLWDCEVVIFLEVIFPSLMKYVYNSDALGSLFVHKCMHTGYWRASIRGGSRIFIWGRGGGAKDYVRARMRAKPEVPYGRDPGPA